MTTASLTPPFANSFVATSKRPGLSAEGNITDDDWLAFESTLLSRWDKIRARIMRMRQGAPEEDVGFEIFTDTTETHCEKLAGSDTEQVYLTSGSIIVWQR